MDQGKRGCIIFVYKKQAIYFTKFQFFKYFFLKQLAQAYNKYDDDRV